MISTSVPIELRSYGPCRYLEAWVGYSMYQMLQTSAFMSGMSILITFFFKYEVVRCIELPRCRIIVIVLAFHIPIFISMIMEVIMIITQSLPDDVRQCYKLLNTNVEEFSVIGALSLKTLPSIINFALISGSVVLAPFVCFFYKNKILLRINSQLNQHSKQRKTLIQVFVKGLTIQAFLPLIFYVPVFALYFYCILTHAEILFQQYFMTVVPSLPALFDPFVTLYFVTPYRRRLKIWMRIEKASKIMPVITSQVY
ncbi:hypothetical protein GCK72_025421 [Caenorhabditis remanei]|nr:hypothetical protein GCK72_025421 [Caenorhabditis remanei]KAF1748954.1 hypothetical protein GCK72_025421 [Caenorhabditis remanei]